VRNKLSAAIATANPTYMINICTRVYVEIAHICACVNVDID